MSTPRRHVLITGASRGIGRAAAIAFASQGDRLALHYAHNRDEADATRDLLPGSGHVLVRADLGQTQAAPRLMDDIIRQLGHVDVLVNNAGAAPTAGNRHRVDIASFENWAAAWQSMISVNLLGAAHLSWAFAQHLIDREQPGAIVNVGSRGAFRGEPDYPAYGASKAALHALGQSLAVALAPHHITVSTVAPGFVATDRQQAKLLGTEGQALREQSPFGRVGTPEEVASAILYLASPEAAWSSGAILDVNGASYLRT